MEHTLNNKNNNAPQRSFSLVQAGFWMSFCVSVSFAAVYLQALDYSNGRLGVILAIGNVTGILCSMFLSTCIDQYEKLTAKILIPWILALQAVSVLVLLVINDDSLAVSIAFIAYIGFCTTVNALNLKLYADADHAGYKINYGVTRGVGSVAYVIISVALGLILEGISYRALPVIGLVLCALQFAAFRNFSHFVADGEKAGSFGERHSSLPSFFKDNPRYAIILTGVVLLYFGHSTACNFLINIVRDVGGNTADLGFITAFKGIVEIPIMFLYAKFFKDGKHALALRISAIAFVLKTLAFIASGSEWQLMASFILQMPSYALYMSAVVYYVNENIDFKDSAKAQSLAFTTTTFGGMLASLIGGQLYDSFSVNATLWIAFAVGAVGAVIMFIGTRKQK